jgi:hypothetical protein
MIPVRRIAPACICALLAGCAPPATMPSRPEPTEVVAQRPLSLGMDAEPLARLSPPARNVDLLDYQQFWCARPDAEREQRRARLGTSTDALEAFLLDYCEGVGTRPEQLEAQLLRLASERVWPEGYRAYFAWLRWHLRTFATSEAQARAERARLQLTIEQLRAIEADLNTRTPAAELRP